MLDNLAFACRNLVYFFILLQIGHTHARSSDVLKLISNVVRFRCFSSRPSSIIMEYCYVELGNLFILFLNFEPQTRTTVKFA